jgi:hypothetical protein
MGDKVKEGPADADALLEDVAGAGAANAPKPMNSPLSPLFRRVFLFSLPIVG